MTEQEKQIFIANKELLYQLFDTSINNNYEEIRLKICTFPSKFFVFQVWEKDKNNLLFNNIINRQFTDNDVKKYLKMIKLKSFL